MSKDLVKIKRRKVCIRDLKHRITLHTRDIDSPDFGEVDYQQNYTPLARVSAAITTINGKTFFDGVSQDQALTHAIYIRHRSGISSEIWVELKDQRRLKVLDTEFLDERNEFILLLCTERGPKELNANLV